MSVIHNFRMPLFCLVKGQPHILGRRRGEISFLVGQGVI